MFSYAGSLRADNLGGGKILYGVIIIAFIIRTHGRPFTTRRTNHCIARATELINFMSVIAKVAERARASRVIYFAGDCLSAQK